MHPKSVIRTEQDVFEIMQVDTRDRTQADCRDLVRKHLFKFTSCGASCTFEPEGVLLHTIVEGSEAEFAHMLHYPIKSEHWWTTLNWLEVKAHQAWIETQDYSDYPAEEKIDMSTYYRKVNTLLEEGGRLDSVV